MKKKNLVLTVITVAILSVGLYIGRTSIFNSEGYSDLILQNVEALSQFESEYNSSDCALDGSPIYSNVRSFSGQREVVEHVYGGFNSSSGIDRCYTVEYVGCEAYGIGNIPGNNYSIPVNFKDFKEVRCSGPMAHKSFF